jgi:S1-C subfamily serine protease
VLVSGPGGVSDSATGFLADDGRVVTVAHVLDSGGTVIVRGAGRQPRRTRVLRATPRDDLALLALDGGIAAFEAPPARGTRLLSAHKGRPTAAAADVRRRIRARVSDPAGSPTYTRRALELAAEVTGGYSGSPVVGADGRLLGVVFARSEHRPGIAYATDAAAVASLLGKPARSAQQTPPPEPRRGRGGPAAR